MRGLPASPGLTASGPARRPDRGPRARLTEAALITDPDDPRIADYRALTDVELRTRWEPPNGLFIAEGELVLRRALRAGYRPRSVLVDVKRVDELPDVGRRAGLRRYPGRAGEGDRLPRAPGGARVVPPQAGAWTPPRYWPVPAGWRSSRTSTTTPTWARSSGARRRWAWTRCCCRRPAPIRSTGVACGSAWARCSRCRTPGWSRGRRRWTRCGTPASACWR